MMYFLNWNYFTVLYYNIFYTTKFVKKIKKLCVSVNYGIRTYLGTYEYHMVFFFCAYRLHNVEIYDLTNEMLQYLICYPIRVDGIIISPHFNLSQVIFIKPRMYINDTQCTLQYKHNIIIYIYHNRINYHTT